MTDTPNPRLNLSEAAILDCRNVSLIAYPLDDRTLGTALVLDTEQFGQIVAPLTISQVRALGATCLDTANATPQDMARMMQTMNDDKE
ncbi:hypothetical protein [[Mycobacterium] burgundiense]|uniref:Uncharacterized protein n=1 Tax=[Mycobacterium] burgundiense TaxID=3064286 RepID=A0ABM9L9C2_9MYCO|nr:hypothetical protein [Mycolicibacterium sp. MU0053]CAJ1495108.1 hypothetical protein MU0053_000272 [Mycolicibacterium sp. MU0053]